MAEKVQKGICVFNKLFLECHKSLQQHITDLNNIADDLDKFHKNTKIAQITGNSVSATGGIMTLTGLALAPFTFGASLVVMAVGLGVGAAGTLTSAGAGISNMVNNFMDRDKVEKIIEDYQKKMEDLIKALEFIKEGVKNLQQFDSIQYQAENNFSDLSSIFCESAKAGLQIALIGKTVGKKAAGAAKIANRATGVLSALFVGLDIYFVAKNSKELKNGAKSELATEIREAAKQLQDDLVELNTVRENLQAAAKPENGTEELQQKKEKKVHYSIQGLQEKNERYSFQGSQEKKEYYSDEEEDEDDDEERNVIDLQRYENSRLVIVKQLLKFMKIWIKHRKQCAKNLRKSIISKATFEEAKKLYQKTNRSFKVLVQRYNLRCSEIRKIYDVLRKSHPDEVFPAPSLLVMMKLLQTLGELNGFSDKYVPFMSWIVTDKSATDIDKIFTKNILRIMAFFNLSVENNDLRCLFNDVHEEMKRNVGQSSMGGFDLFPSTNMGNWKDEFLDSTANRDQLQSVANGMMKAVKELQSALDNISAAFETLPGLE